MRLAKGQAAMEFLLTYGWAMLSVLVVISALAYFGVLDVRAMMPKHCSMTLGMECMDFEIEYSEPFGIGKSDFLLVLRNVIGHGIYITDIQLVSGKPYTSERVDAVQDIANLKIYCENFDSVRRNNDPGDLQYMMTAGEKAKCKLFDFRKKNKPIKHGQEDQIGFKIVYVDSWTKLQHNMIAQASRS